LSLKEIHLSSLTELGIELCGHALSLKKSSIKIILVRYQWLMPIILAMQEAEIRRIPVQIQSQANSSQDPISKNTFTIKGLVK
jgi:hypothetical protein